LDIISSRDTIIISSVEKDTHPSDLA